MTKYKYIIIHHSATKDGDVVDWQAIRRYHKSWAYQGKIIKEADARNLIAEGKEIKHPWRDTGYNFGVEKINGEIETLVGRPLTLVGAHTKGRNHDSIGICCVGNYDKDTPSPEMINALENLCIVLVDIFSISIQDIKGHRAFAAKSCPGINLDVQKVIDGVARKVIGKVTKYDYG